MDVRELGVALWRQRPLVLMVLLVVAGAVALGVLLAPKSYAATATVAVGAEPGTPSSAAAGSDADVVRASLAELANSATVVEEARDQLDADRTTDELRRAVTGHWARGTALVEVEARDRDPDVAAAVANAVASVLAGQELGELGGPGLDASVRDRAQVPTSSGRPDLRLAIALGTLLAVGLATAAAVARDRRTHTVDDAAGVEEAATAPLLAHLVAPRDPTQLPALRAGTAEADLFRHLQVTLAHGGGARRAVVASVTHGEEHVWVGANVAIALATTGRRVLLVDGRMGERSGAPVEQAPDTPGLYDVLCGADLDTALSPGPVERLQVLPPGTYGGAPVPELLTERFAEVMDAAAATFDHVLVLGPALEESDDSRLMAADGALVLTVVEGAVSATALRAHAGRVRAAGARLLGVVLIGPSARGVVA